MKRLDIRRLHKKLIYLQNYIGDLVVDYLPEN